MPGFVRFHFLSLPAAGALSAHHCTACVRGIYLSQRKVCLSFTCLDVSLMLEIAGARPQPNIKLPPHMSPGTVVCALGKVLAPAVANCDVKPEAAEAPCFHWASTTSVKFHQ